MINETLADFAERTASKEPIPGGGSVSSYVGALAASLAEMVIHLSISKARFADKQDELKQHLNRLEVLHQSLLAAIQKDIDAFLPLSELYHSDPEAADYRQKMDDALFEAAKAPLEMMQLCSEVIAIDEQLLPITTKLAVSDIANSVMLAQAALYCGQINVQINTRLMHDQKQAQDLDDQARICLERYAPLALMIYTEIQEAL